jgi:hypothetical protein
MPSASQYTVFAGLFRASLRESAEVDEQEIAMAWDTEIAQRVAEVKAGTAVTCSLQELETDLQALVGR